mmetsp:Transcript_27138/g.56506  ORF Transcript_27138/g.56506 Transcript_27138/m.56506 type:complete len:282 (-) Transcript_27138:184-1029(-)
MGMGGVYWTPDSAFHFWRCPFPTGHCARLVSATNKMGDISINDLKLLSHLAQLTLIFPTMQPLTLSAHGSNNFISVSWVKRDSISCNTIAGHILRARALLLRHHCVHDTLGFLTGRWNGMADTVSQLWTLSNNELTDCFNSMFPQPTSWQHSHLPPETRHVLITTLHNGTCNMASLLGGSRPTAPTGQSGPLSAATWEYPLTSLTLTTQYHSCRSLPTASALASWPQRAAKLKSAWWNNTSVPSARSLPSWGPKTHDWTAWGTSIFASTANSPPTKRKTRP